MLTEIHLKSQWMFKTPDLKQATLRDQYLMPETRRISSSDYKTESNVSKQGMS